MLGMVFEFFLVKYPGSIREKHHLKSVRFYLCLELAYRRNIKRVKDRIIDGAEAVQFLVRIKQMIEDPRRLLLEL